MIEDLMVLLGLPEEIDEELENKLLLIFYSCKAVAVGVTVRVK